ncbi:MAG TPA: glycosyltransferase family 4 protein [Alphaproteobacteria bacterium]|nr:glycosyltransferase family 4 protein [Alphaproteobacteria bacterium]
MRILTLCYEFPPVGGGGSKVVYGLSKELSRLGHKIDVVTMGFGELPPHERIENLDIYRLKSFRRRQHMCGTIEMVRHDIAAAPFVLNLIRRNNYDLNHTHFIFPDGLTALIAHKLTGLPYIITAHGSDVPKYNPDRFTVQHKLLAPAWKAVVNGSARIVCPSVHLSALLNARNHRAATSIIPNALDPGKFRHDREKRNRVLMVTRMFPRKGVQKFFSAVKDADISIEANIVGDGPYLETLRQMASATNVKSRFWGWLDNDSAELRELYETSSIFVFLSESENFPINLLEAMAAGMAIVTSAGSGCSEVVGDAALKVNPDSPTEIRDALHRLINDRDFARTLGAEARRRFDHCFTWPAVAKQYDALYQEIAPRPSRTCDVKPRTASSGR